MGDGEEPGDTACVELHRNETRRVFSCTATRSKVEGYKVATKEEVKAPMNEPVLVSTLIIAGSTQPSQFACVARSALDRLFVMTASEMGAR